jgi:hypothetical protein
MNPMGWKNILIGLGAALLVCAAAVGVIQISGSENIAEETEDTNIAEQIPDTEKIPDINGEWLITNTVESTDYKAYVGLKLEFRVVFRQSGSQFTAEGEKYRENDRTLPKSQRTGILLKGSIEGNTVRGDITEHGRKGESVGELTWALAGPDKMVGTFVSEAAHSAGPSVAIRTADMKTRHTPSQQQNRVVPK